MFNINFGNIFGEITTVTLDIYQGNALVQKQQLSGPSDMLVAQFKRMAMEAAKLHGRQPMRIKMWQMQPIYDKDNKYIHDIEISLDFRNWFEEGEEE